MTDFKNIPLIKPQNNLDIKNAIIFLHGYGANGKDLINIGHEWKEKHPHGIYLSECSI